MRLLRVKNAFRIGQDIIEYDTNNGDFIRSYCGRGYDENSCWSRGIAWAVYGSVLSYKYTGEKRYLNAAVKTADYFIANVCSRCYTAAAINILKATNSDFCDYCKDNDALVKMGTERYPQNGNFKGVHIPIIYGDFFFAEAMLKLKGEEFLIW